MTASVASQRWTLGGVPAWRYPGDHRRDPSLFTFDPGRYGVATITTAQARPFCTDLHYLHSYPQAKQRYGMFDLSGPSPRLVGVEVLSVPPSNAVLTNVFPRLAPNAEALTVSRFILLDEVPHNGESWFFAQCARLATATGLRGLVMFSDPVPRRRPDGTLVFPGHAGTIYQASGAVYTGTTKPRISYQLPDGTVLDERALQKIRGQERGHGYAMRKLMGYGAPAPRAGEKPSAWLRRALPTAGAEPRKDPGKYRYAFALGPTRRQRDAVKIGLASLPYPKKDPSWTRRHRVHGGIRGHLHEQP
jgi:hypothetical protein